MLLRYLLDTNTLSDLVHYPRCKVAARIASVCYVVTANIGEFSRVPGLKVENRLE